MSNFLDVLNDAQRRAVEYTDGAVSIIAGPGSGKTRVLTYRIAYLLSLKVDPFRILALTFTNKAAKEMRERVEQLVGTEARNLYIGTFHSVFARILRYEAQLLGYPSNFSIYDTDDAKSVIKSIIREMGLNDTYYKPGNVYNRISGAKNELMTPDDYSRNMTLVAEDTASGKPRLHEVYKIYADRCFKSGAMDFDDLLLKMYQLIVNFPAAAYKYQNRFRYVLVDEFQDTNFAQYEIVKRLASVHQNITVVGDDAQSIYSFRGATIENILNFDRDFPERAEFKLEQNYRSTQHIVKAANSVITKNKKQIAKEIWTDNSTGEKIKLFRAMSDNDEGRLVVDNIFEEKMRSQRHNKEFAILYRTNAQSRSFEEAFRRLNIPYVIYGGTSFYQRKEIKDLIAYLRLTVNHNDEEALKRVINYPARGIGQTTMDKAQVVASQNDVRLWDVFEKSTTYLTGSRSANSIDNFVTMIQSFTLMQEHKNAYDLAMHIAKHSGILKELHNDKSVEGISRYENLNELLNGIKEFVETDMPEITPDGEVLNSLQKDKSLGRWLQEISLLTDTDKKDDDDDKVKLMSIHAAKGLEFPIVYVVGLEENLFPSLMAMDSREDLEEERRLFYVAITRARHRLHLSYAVTRYRYGNLTYCEPSRFLQEINPDNVELMYRPEQEPSRNLSQQKLNIPVPKIAKPEYVHQPANDFVPDDAMTLQVGMEVEHQRFGFGKVVALDGSPSERMATIFFQNDVGQKKIMLKFAKLRIVNRNQFSLN